MRQVFFLFNLGLILIRKKFWAFLNFLETISKMKKSGRIVLLGMIQTMFDQNMSPID